MYVKCVKDQCGQQAADYALTLDKFSIEVQGGTCDFQGKYKLFFKQLQYIATLLFKHV